MNHNDEIDHDEIAANDADQRSEQQAELDAERLRVSHLRAWAMLRQVAEIATSCQEGFDVLNQALRHDNADDVEAELVTIEALLTSIVADANTTMNALCGEQVEASALLRTPPRSARTDASHRPHRQRHPRRPARRCPWLIHVPSHNPEPDTPHDLVTTIECGAQTTTDEHGCWTCTNGHAHHALGSPCRPSNNKPQQRSSSEPSPTRTLPTNSTTTPQPRLPLTVTDRCGRRARLTRLRHRSLPAASRRPPWPCRLPGA